MVLLVGVLVPDVGAFLLVLVPPQGLVPEWVIRVVMLIGAIVVPGVVGGLTFVLARPAGRSTISAWVTSVLRGYPLTALLARPAGLPRRPGGRSARSGASPTAGRTRTSRSW